MIVVSLDLAIRRVADNGLVVLSERGAGVAVERVVLAERLDGAIAAEPLADALVALATERCARVICIDGPQAWRAERSSLVHLRHCEKAVRAPGKTGLPGIVKPASWARFAEQSVALFDALDARGWPRCTAAPRSTVAVESFPTAAWRALGLRPLASKSRARAADIGEACARLVSALPRPLALEFTPTHDELQAIVGGWVGLALAAGDTAAFELHGEAPFVERGIAREGFIATPRSAPEAHRR